MNMNEILDRIETLAERRGKSLRAVSIEASGSADLIRNWQRASREGKPFSARIEMIEKVARALDTTLRFLLEGVEDATPGFADADVAPYTASRNTMSALGALVAPSVEHMQMFRVTKAAPWLGALSGDVLIVDAKAEARAGDLVIANMEGGAGEGVTTIRRWMPPYLLSCTPNENFAAASETAARSAILGVVRGLLRGPALTGEAEAHTAAA